MDCPPALPAHPACHSMAGRIAPARSPSRQAPRRSGDAACPRSPGLARAAARASRRPTRRAPTAVPWLHWRTCSRRSHRAVSASAFESAFPSRSKRPRSAARCRPVVNPSSTSPTAPATSSSATSCQHQRPKTSRPVDDLTPSGHQSLFAQITPASLPKRAAAGLTTALANCPGYVVVGSCRPRTAKRQPPEGC